MKRLSTLIAGIADSAFLGDDPFVEDITIDIEEVRRGTLYVARKDWYGNTHAYVHEAFSRGACAVMVSEQDLDLNGRPWIYVEAEDPALGLLSRRFFDAPTSKLKVLGVTGTNGKTSVVHLMEHLLCAMGEKPAVMGTLGYRCGVLSRPATNTTPDAIVIHRFAAEALAFGATVLLLEVSSHGLAIGRTAGLDFDCVGFTNLTQDHLDFHGSLDTYFEAKSILFSSILEYSRAQGKLPKACIFCASEWAQRLSRRVPDGIEQRLIATRVDRPTADWVISSFVESGDKSTQLQIETTAETTSVPVPFAADFYLANASLAVAMVEMVSSAPLQVIMSQLRSFGGVPGRLEEVLPSVYVDYAHTPDALARVLKSLNSMVEQPITVVVGCGGERDQGKRGAMARAARAGAEHVVLTSDNPRGEDPFAILADMAAAIDNRYVVEANRSKAIELALKRTGLILIAGKGHETTQEIQGHKYHFDDREEVRRLSRAQKAAIEVLDAPYSWGWTAVDEVGSTQHIDRFKSVFARLERPCVVEDALYMRHRDLILQKLHPEQIFAMMSQDAVAEVTPRHRLVYVDRQKVDVQLDFDESTALLEWLEGEF